MNLPLTAFSPLELAVLWHLGTLGPMTRVQVHALLPERSLACVGVILSTLKSRGVLCSQGVSAKRFGAGYPIQIYRIAAPWDVSFVTARAA